MKTSVRVPASTSTWSNNDSSNNMNAGKQRRNQIHQKKSTASEVDAYAQRVLEQAAGMSGTAGADGSLLSAATGLDGGKGIGSSESDHEPCVIDESLGPYVTSCLRSSRIASASSPPSPFEAMSVVDLDVTDIPDFESLCELLQEHCQIEQEAAAKLLKRIAEAVFSGRVDPIDVSVSALITSADHGHDPDTEPHQFASLTLSSVVDCNLSHEHQQPPPHHGYQFQLQTQQYQYDQAAAQSAAVISPQAAGNFLPGNLLEEEDDDDGGDDHVNDVNDDGGEAVLSCRGGGGAGDRRGGGSSTVSVSVSSSSPPRDDAAFPPLAAATAQHQQHQESSKATSQKKMSKHHGIFPPKSNSGTSSGIGSQSSKLEKSSAATAVAEKELAAALFRPSSSRSRQSSIDESSYSTSIHSSPTLHATTATPPTAHQQQPFSIPQQQSMQLLHQHQQHYSYNSNPYSSTTDEQQQQQLLQQQQEHHLHSTAEILLSMNSDLSEDAAYAAATLAGADLNVAQYIVEQAVAQLPVCRHLLSDGCYRADCSFSHDIDSHTCLFWLQRRCGKREQCRFLHGFSEKLLENLPEQYVLEQQENLHSSVFNHGGNNNDTAENDNAALDYYSGGGGQLLGQHQHQPYVGDSHGGGYSTSSHSDYGGGAYGNNSAAHPQANSSLWIPSPPPSSSNHSTSFSNIASQGYDTRQSFANSSHDAKAMLIPTVSIPQDLWNPNENRDSTAFYISDPLERYYAVTAAIAVPRDDVIDLHFQSLKTFHVVLDTILPAKLQQQQQQQRVSTLNSVWIVTGTGHHVGSRTHQKGGGALEAAVLEYLTVNYDCYAVSRGRDRNGQGGAVLVQQKRLR